MMIPMITNDIRRIWSAQESASGNHVIRTRLDGVADLNCFIGLIGATGARIFQLEVDASLTINRNYLRKFRGVDIQVLPLNDTFSTYTIILLEKELTDVFVMFIEDIVDKIGGINNSEDALTAINQRVNYWRKLFSRASGDLLTAEKQRGLFGELVFLRQALQNPSNCKEVILSWRGSAGGNQDFVRNSNAVEIKTTKASSSHIYIANEQQLDFRAWDNLYLGLITVTESTGIMNSLPSLIEEIKHLLAYDTLLCAELDKKLERAGLNPELVENYADTSYLVGKRKYYVIQKGFPIITKDNLNHDAIFNVQYQIDLSNCASYEVAEEIVLTHLYRTTADEYEF